MDGYITSGNAKDMIIYTRKKFFKIVKERKAPPVIPTVFRNHPEQLESIREGEQIMHNAIMPLYKSTFTDDVYVNILCNISYDEFKGFIKHGEIAKVVCLNSGSYTEDAFEELLSCQPTFYSFDFEKVKTSKFADNNKANWGPLSKECCGCYYTFNVDFSAIYPENIVSTVIVTCTGCGRFFETVFCDLTKKLIMAETMYNIGKMPVARNDLADEEGRTDVIRLQTRSSIIKSCHFMETLIGVKPLISLRNSTASVFTRTRITFYCNDSSPLGLLLHHKKYIEPGLFPSFKELMDMFNLS